MFMIKLQLKLYILVCSHLKNQIHSFKPLFLILHHSFVYFCKTMYYLIKKYSKVMYVPGIYAAKSVQNIFEKVGIS